MLNLTKVVVEDSKIPYLLILYALRLCNPKYLPHLLPTILKPGNEGLPITEVSLHLKVRIFLDLVPFSNL